MIAGKVVVRWLGYGDVGKGCAPVDAFLRCAGVLVYGDRIGDLCFAGRYGGVRGDRTMEEGREGRKHFCGRQPGNCDVITLEHMQADEGSGPSVCNTPGHFDNEIPQVDRLVNVPGDTRHTNYSNRRWMIIVLPFGKCHFSVGRAAIGQIWGCCHGASVVCDEQFVY